MARVRGSIPFSSNYEGTISKPMDARMLVPSYADLLDSSNWLTSKGTPCCYNGMLVAVANTTDTSKNGLYMLFDSTNTRKPDVTVENNWLRIGETSDISSFVERVEQIETEISTISEQLSGLDTRVRSLEVDKVIVTRDNEYNYKQRTPVANEICLVDVAGQGLRVKVGDGETPFSDLPYIDDSVLNTVDTLIVKGYLYQGQFYKDSAHTELLADIPGRLYIDIVTSKTYGFNGVKYESTAVTASASVAGIVKLYDEVGTNVDGAMTQKAVTEELNQKIEVEFVPDEELLVFDTDFDDNI